MEWLTAQRKVALTFIIGIIGIAFSTLYFASQDWPSAPFWAEFAKWVPGIAISALALMAAGRAEDEGRNARNTAERGEVEARSARETAERGEHEARAGRVAGERAEVLAGTTEKAKRRAEKREEKIAYGTGVKGAAKRAKAHASAARQDRKDTKAAALANR